MGTFCVSHEDATLFQDIHDGRPFRLIEPLGNFLAEHGTFVCGHLPTLTEKGVNHAFSVCQLPDKLDFRAVVFAFVHVRFDYVATYDSVINAFFEEELGDAFSAFESSEGFSVEGKT